MMVLDTITGKASWRDVNATTQYEDNFWSWMPAAAVALADRIEGIKYYSVVDYQLFGERGEEYFKELNASRPEWFEVQKQHASPGFIKEREAAATLLKRNLFEQRMLTRTEMEGLLASNMMIALVDAGRLAKKNQSLSHFVLVYNESAENFILHDPGLPPMRAWLVNKQLFMKAFENEVIVIPKGTLNFGTDVGRNKPCPCGSRRKFKWCHGR
jgi:SEC-C motif